jgi:CMP/dCMP kinase
MPKERLQRILARAGLGSRRACERLIVEGRLTVDDKLVTELGAMADPESSVICVDGRPIHAERTRYIVLHKPAGFLSNPDSRSVHPSWLDLVSVPERLYPVGRLDLDSEGLLLLTNDGDLAQHLTHPRFEHPKTYLVQVVGVPDPRKLRRLRHGIMLEDGPTAPADVLLLRAPPQQAATYGKQSRSTPAEGRIFENSSKDLRRPSWLRVTLREGRKRQLRRMVARLGHPAMRVIRISIGPLELGELPAGKWREMRPSEVELLRVAALRENPSEQAIRRGDGGSGVGHAPGESRRPRSRAGQNPKSSLQLPRSIAIDGPSASGKSTVGRRLAKRLGYLYFDTGVMYRAVAFVALSRAISLSDEAAITALARRIVLGVLPPGVEDGRDVTVLADGVDITWEIRSREVEQAVSPVAAYPGVRDALRQSQRNVGLAGKVVMVGRDIGTTVLPEADLKIYLDAALRERAHRRHAERLERGETVSIEEVLADIRRRDEIDSTREHAPLAAASDAIVIDTTSLSVEQVMDRVVQLTTGRAGSRKR